MEPPQILEYWSIDNFDTVEAVYGVHAQSLERGYHKDENRRGHYSGALSFWRYWSYTSAIDDNVTPTPCTGPLPGEGSYCDACIRRATSADESLQSIEDHLHEDLYAPLLRENPETDYCNNNLTPAAIIWHQEPAFYKSLPQKNMNFLQQVAAMCRASQLSICEHCNPHDADIVLGAPRVAAWESLREWAITAMLCQRNHRVRESRESEPESLLGHNHIASTVAGLAMVMSECSRPCYQKPAFSIQDTQLVTEVSELIYWMVSIQYHLAIGPDQLGRWRSDLIPRMPWADEDPLEKAIGVLSNKLTHICKFRLWNMFELSDRQIGDIPVIINALKETTPEEFGDDHVGCAANFCHQAVIDSTKKEQAHKDGCRGCDKVALSDEGFEDSIRKSITDGIPVAWALEGTPRTIGKDEEYVALSHVWSDGTGKGTGNAYEVNSCLWNFWREKVGVLGVSAVWWDTISIPREENLRRQALDLMHHNYETAKHTLVHDEQLTQFQWSDDGMPCIALALSNWFARAWTALELSMSKSVKVLFKHPTDGIYPYDLDGDILAKSPETASPAHWIATCLIRGLREPINDVGDIMRILKARATSRPRDKTLIAALLARFSVAEFEDSEIKNTQTIMGQLGKIPSLSLLHGKATMTDDGPWSWCTPTLFDMPPAPPIDVESRKMSDFLSLLDITDAGAVHGDWYCHKLEPHEAQNIMVFGSDPSCDVKVQIALMKKRQTCLLLRPLAKWNPARDPALLVVWKGADATRDYCQYIGAVWELHDATVRKKWYRAKVQMGTSRAQDSTDDFISTFEDVLSRDYLPNSNVESPRGKRPGVFRASSNGEPTSSVANWTPTFIDFLTQQNQGLTKYLAHYYPPPEVSEMLGMIKEDHSQTSFHQLWRLGDINLKLAFEPPIFENGQGRSEFLKRAEEAYSSAHSVFEDMESFDESRSQSQESDKLTFELPKYSRAMLRYQQGLVKMLRHSNEGTQTEYLDDLKETFHNALEELGKAKETLQTPAEAQENLQEDDGVNELDGFYFVKRSALGALTLLHLQGWDEGHSMAAGYFMRSLRQEELNRLELHDGLAFIKNCLELANGENSGLTLLHIKASIEPEAKCIDYTRDYVDPDGKLTYCCRACANPNVQRIDCIRAALESILQKFDVLFRRKHILCSISSLCLGVAEFCCGRLIRSGVQLRRTKEDLMGLLISGEDWNLFKRLEQLGVQEERLEAEEERLEALEELEIQHGDEEEGQHEVGEEEQYGDREEEQYGDGEEEEYGE